MSVDEQGPVDPETLIEKADEARERKNEDAVEAFKWFDENEGMHLIEDVIDTLSESKSWSIPRARNAIIGVTDDSLDPVQVISDGRQRYVGIIDYERFSDEGGYCYVEYDDTKGSRNMCVCGRCVETEDMVQSVWRAASGETYHREEDKGVIQNDEGWEPLLDRLERHYEVAHDIEPEEVEIAASLVSGTTISSSTAWHDGNVTGGTDITVGATSVDHSDTSTAGDQNNSGTTAVQDVTIDGRGHVTAMTAADVGTTVSDTLTNNENFAPGF